MSERVSFITGSRAYGENYVTEDSDIDIVILAERETIADLFRLAFKDHGNNKLQFGKINLVTFNADDPDDVRRYDRWKEANDYLIFNKPKSKEEAIAKFRELDAESAYKRGRPE